MFVHVSLWLFYYLLLLNATPVRWWAASSCTPCTTTVARAPLHVSASYSSWMRRPPAHVRVVVVMSTPHGDPHAGPGARAAAAEEEGGGNAALSAGSGKLSRLMCAHPRRRTSASYARAASSLVAKYPTS